MATSVMHYLFAVASPTPVIASSSSLSLTTFASKYFKLNRAYLARPIPESKFSFYINPANFVELEKSMYWVGN